MNKGQLLRLVRGAEQTSPIAPFNIVPPSISGLTVQGQTLTGNPGMWGGGIIGYAYRWLADGVPVDGAIGLTFTPTVAEVEAEIAFEVRAVGVLTDTVAISAAVGPITASSPILPTLQLVDVGAKTFLGHGEHDLGYTGDGYLGITAGNTLTQFAINERNRFVKAGTYGGAPSGMLDDYTLTLTEYSDAEKTIATGVTGTVEVTRVANRYDVASAPSNENSSTFQAGTAWKAAAYGDEIVMRAGTYNAGTEYDWRLQRVAAPTGTYDETNPVVLKAEVEGSVIIKRISVDGSNQPGFEWKVQGIHFNRQYTGASTTGSEQAAGCLAIVNGATTGHVDRCEISSNPDGVTGLDMRSGLVMSANSSGLRVTNSYIHDVFVGLNLYGADAYVSQCTILGTWEDGIKYTLPTNWYFGYTIIADKKHSDNYGSTPAPGHPDFLQLNTSAGNPTDGTKVGGVFENLVLIRNNGRTGWIDGQLLFIEGKAKLNVRFDYILIQNVIGIGTMGNGIHVDKTDIVLIRNCVCLGDLTAKAELAAQGSSDSTKKYVRPAMRFISCGTRTIVDSVYHSLVDDVYLDANEDGAADSNPSTAPADPTGLTLTNNTVISDNLTAYQALFADPLFKKTLTVDMDNHLDFNLNFAPKVGGAIETVGGVFNVDGSWRTPT